MISLKKASLVLFLPLAVLSATSCNKNANKIETTITGVVDRAFGNIVFDLNQRDFENAGFNYDDLMEFTIHDYNGTGKDLSFEAAFVKNYNEAGYFAPCLCNYGAKQERPQLSFGIMPQKDEVDYLTGKKVTIKMVEKQGYHKTRELIDVATKLTYEELGRDNLAYANFRDVTSVGTISKHIKPNCIFRGSSPFNSKGNPDERDYVADSYLDVYKIQSEVSLANTDEEIDNLMTELNKKRFQSYTYRLYDDSKNISEAQKEDRTFYSVCLGGDYFSLGQGKDGENARKVFEYFAKRTVKLGTPAHSVYFHCDEGKDRTGFFAMILEALAGCPLNDLVADAMLTFKNYYNVSVVNNKEKYDALANLLIYRHIYSILVDNPLEVLPKINWYEFDAKAAVEKIIGSFGNILSECARRYLISINVSREDIDYINAWVSVQPNN